MKPQNLSAGPILTRLLLSAKAISRSKVWYISSGTMGLARSIHTGVVGAPDILIKRIGGHSNNRNCFCIVTFKCANGRLDLKKQFFDGQGNTTNVSFVLYNDKDKYYVQAKLKGGIYFVAGHSGRQSNAMVFSPVTGVHIVVKGLEDDSYIA